MDCLPWYAESTERDESEDRMPLQGEYEPGTADWVNEQVETIEKSGGTEGTTMRGKPVVVLTTQGAKTGKLRKFALMRVEHEGSYVAVASKGGAPTNPVWFNNLVAHPHVEVQDGPHKADYSARLLSGEERQTWWERALEVWPDYADYQEKTDREIPLFVLEPQG